MTNREIYSKTLTFSLRRALFDLISIILLIGLAAAGYFITEKTMNKGLIGLGIGIILGLIVTIVISRFVSYSLKAGQIAMMMKGVTEGTLPDNVYSEGKAMVKERFLTVAAFFAVTGAVRSIFNALGNTITRVGDKLGGDTGRGIGSAISTAVSVLIGYLCDCCLGWVFYRKEVSSAKAACEGSVIFFKHGKTLLKNMGRIFGMGIASFVIIAGPFAALFYGILTRFPQPFNALVTEMMEAAARNGGEVPELLTSPQNIMILCAVIAAAIIWSIIHGVFIRPFVLTGVMRNYMDAGMKDVPTESSFSLLDGKSKKFDKLREQIA